MTPEGSSYCFRLSALALAEELHPRERRRPQMANVTSPLDFEES